MPDRDNTSGADGGREEPVTRDNRKIDPETGEVRASGSTSSEDGGTAAVDGVEDLIQAEDADVETSTTDAPDLSAPNLSAEALSAEDASILADAERDLVADMRNDMLRAQAELVNFRNRVERDRAANREIVIAKVLRSLLPAMDDLVRAEKHGDLEGSPLALVAQKLHGAFERYGLRVVGEVGEPFDPNFHEALVQLPSPDVTVNTVADVVEPGYALGDRLIRAAKVAVHVPAE